MPHYKDALGNPHYLDSTDHEHLLPMGSVQITDAEAAALRSNVSIADLRAAALATLPAWEAAERAAGIDHAGRKWLTTPAALQDIRDALMAEAAPPGGVWIDAARQPAPMTLADLKAQWGAIFARGAAIYQRRLEMEQAIATLPRAELESFKPGWPPKL